MIPFDTTMITSMDDLDVECLTRRLQAAKDRLQAATAPAVVTDDMRGASASIETIRTEERQSVLKIKVGRTKGMGTLLLEMPTPDWWSPEPQSVRTHFERILDTWTDLTATRRMDLTATRRMDLDSLNVSGTGLEVLCRRMGALLSSAGVGPKKRSGVHVRVRLPYHVGSKHSTYDPMIMLDPKSRTVGAARKRFLTAEAEAALLSGQHAFLLETTGARCFRIARMPIIDTGPIASDPMDTLRLLQELGLDPNGRHVLKAAHSLDDA